ncbi:MAG: hypothetical protein K2H64_10230 [Desulfovibrio sp.]|nr:hypothetical protein [Desulfovibrio sp.]
MGDSKAPLAPERRFAAPSWITPGDIPTNSRILAEVFGGCALCFFESAASLKYDDRDLPPELAELPIRWHLHLPCDLPEDNPTAAAEVCLALEKKARFLAPELAALHPPSMGDAARKREYLEIFMSRWREDSSVPLVLENISSCDLAELGEDFFDEDGFGVCLDVAHALRYGQRELLRSSLPEKAALVHWSAPGDGDMHASLANLAGEELAVARGLAPRLSDDAIHLLEIFAFQPAVSSIPILNDILAGQKGKPNGQI